MKEIPSQSPWIGKILTCKRCNRSYMIEPGDELLPAWSGNSKAGRFSYPLRFDLPCGHYIAVDPIDETKK